MDTAFIIKKIQEAIDLKSLMLDDSQLIKNIDVISNLIITCYKSNGKVFWCGNGGSAADAQHLSAELTGRYYLDRPALFSEALHVNSSYLTSVANDYSFDEVYARLIHGFAKKGDILIGLSTSGNSKNVINALQKANDIGVISIAFTGKTGGKIKDVASILLNVPSVDTPRIQECHMLIGHTICEIVEQALFGNKK